MKRVLIILFIFFEVSAFCQNVPIKLTKSGSNVIPVSVIDNVSDSVKADLLPQLDDTITVRISDSYDTVKLGVKAEWWGFQYGAGLDQSDQIQNIDALEAACEYAATNGYFVDWGAGTCEFYMSVGKTVTIPDNTTLRMIGRGKDKTNFVFYPLVKPYDSGLFTPFSPSKDASLDIQGISFHSQPFRIESYDAEFVVGTDSTKLIITESVRSGFYTDLVGKTIYTSLGYTQAQGYSRTVTAVSGDTITVNSNLTYALDAEGKVAVEFSSSATQSDIDTYGEFWYGDDTGVRFINLTGSGATTRTVWKFKDVKFSGMDQALESSGSRGDIIFEDCDLSSDQIFLGFFNGTIPGRKIYMVNSKLHNIGKIVNGYLPNSSIGVDQTYGAGIYSHDNITHEFVNCDIYDNTASSVRQRSSSGTDTTDPNQVSKYVNCSFWDNAEYHIFTSRTMPSTFTNCNFRNGNINLMWETYMSNCIIDSCLVSTAGSTPVEPRFSMSGGEIKNDARVNFPGSDYNYFDNVRIEPHSSLITVNAAGIEDFRFTDCVVSSNTASTATAFFGEVLPLRAVIDNSELGDLGSTTYFYRNSIDFSYTDTIVVKDIIKITDCQIYGKLWDASQLSVGGIGKVSNTFFAKKANSYPYVSDDFSVRKGISYNTISSTNSAYTNYFEGTHRTWLFDPNFNHFYVTDSVTRAAFSLESGVSRQFSDEITLTVVTSAKITAFDSGSSPNSNFLFGGEYTDGETIKIRYDSRKILAAGTSNIASDDVFTADGTSTKYANWQGVGSNKIVPGTFSITCDGVTLSDDLDGNLTGSGGYGYIDYETQELLIIFDSPPAVSEVATATYDEYTTVYSRGAWYKVE